MYKIHGCLFFTCVGCFLSDRESVNTASKSSRLWKLSCVIAEPSYKLQRRPVGWSPLRTDLKNIIQSSIGITLKSLSSSTRCDIAPVPSYLMIMLLIHYYLLGKFWLLISNLRLKAISLQFAPEVGQIPNPLPTWPEFQIVYMQLPLK